MESSARISLILLICIEIGSCLSINIAKKISNLHTKLNFVWWKFVLHNLTSLTCHFGVKTLFICMKDYERLQTRPILFDWSAKKYCK